MKYIVDIITINYPTDNLLSILIIAESESAVAWVARVAADAPELPLPVASLLPVVVVPPLEVSLARRHTSLYTWYKKNATIPRKRWTRATSA